MRRREFLSWLTGVLGASATAHAQTGPAKRVGLLMSAPLPPLETLRKALRELGYRQGENIRFEDRFAGSSEDRYPALAADLVAKRSDVIVTWGTPATLAAKRATSTIPIVMAAIGDPVGIGAPTLARSPSSSPPASSSSSTSRPPRRSE